MTEQLTKTSALTPVTILLIFLMAVINQIFLISLITIIIKKIRLLIRSTAKKYYCFVLFYIVSKTLLCVVLEIKVITGIPNNFENIKSQDIELVFKNSLVFADCAIIELFMISFEYYLALSFSILGNYRIEKTVRILMQITQIFTFFCLMIPLLIFNLGIINYELLNTFMCSLNCISVIAFIASFFFMNFKMTGILLQKKSSQIIKKVYKLLLGLLLSRLIMASIQVLVLINIKNGSFEDYISIIQDNQGEFITLGFCFILYLMIILLSEGLPLIMSIRQSLVMAFCQSETVRKSSIISSESMNQDLIRQDLLNNFDNDYEQETTGQNQEPKSNIEDIQDLEDVEKISEVAHCRMFKGRHGPKNYFIRQLGNISTYIIEQITKQMQFLVVSEIKCLNKIKILSKNNKIYLLQKFYTKNLDSKIAQLQSNIQKIDLCIKIAKILQQLSEKNYAHGAISPKNIMFDDNQNIVLTGYGLESLRKYLSLTSQYSNITIYTAIELLGNNRQKIISKPTLSSDVYSFGIILYEMFSGNLKYRELSLNNIRQKFLKQNSRPKIPETMSQQMKMIMRKCWLQKPSDRPLISEIISRLENIRQSM